MTNTTSVKNCAQKIKLLILDVDGVLTPGSIVYDSNGHELKFFNVKDGLSIKQLQQANINVAIITARSSVIIEKRATELNIKYLYQNQKSKVDAYHDLLIRLQLDPSEVAYLGDDWPDLPVLLKVGLPAVVNDAEELMKPHAKYITTKNGGQGAVREFAYFILKAQNKLDDLLNYYLVNTEKV